MVSRLFSFTGWSRDHPADQLPGDSLDSELDLVHARIREIETQLGQIRRSDGALKNEIVTKDALQPDFYEQIVTFFRNQVQEDLQNAKTARNVAETSATDVIIALSQAQKAAAQAQSAKTIAETSAASMIVEAQATRQASDTVMSRSVEVGEAMTRTLSEAEGAEAMAGLYANLAGLWAEYMPDTIPPNALAVMDISGDHWSSRWWANQAANAFGKMSELYLGAWPTAPTQTATGGAIPIGAVYYNTTTNQTYVWTGTQWVAFWRPQKAVTASLYYTVAGSTTTAIQVSTAMDDFGNTFNLQDESVEVYVGEPGDPDGALRLKPYSALPAGAETGGYWVDAAAHTIMFSAPAGEPLAAGSLVVMDFLSSPNSLRPGSSALWPLKSFDINPVGGGPGYQDGVRTVFVLARNDAGPIAVESSEELMVYVNAVPQQPGIDYEVTGPTQITFSEAPEADARTWALWMEPVGGAGTGGGGGSISPPDPPADDRHNYLGWNPTGSGSIGWYDGRSLTKIVADNAARLALVSGVDVVTGSLVMQADTRQLYLYNGGWYLYLPTLPGPGSTYTMTFNGLVPEWTPSSGSAATVYIAEVAPPTPLTGQMWLESDSYALFIWQGTAWVQVNSLVATTAGTSAPGNIALPIITGTPTEGQVLTSSTGTWTGSPSSYAYTWKRGGVAISGATSSTYTLVSGDVGGVITVTVTATNANGSNNATSLGTSAVAASPAIPPTSLTGLIGWWDASITASIGVTGANINTVADQSGGGRTMNWSNAHPKYVATGFNTSYPAMLFEPQAVNGYLTAASFPMGTGNTLTAWYVGTFGNLDIGSNDGRAFAYCAPGQFDHNNLNSWGISKVGAGTTQLQVLRNSTVTTVSTNILLPHRVIVTIDSSGVKTIYVNGVGTTGSANVGNWISAGDLRIGANLPGGSFWSGVIAECGVATGFSNAATVAGLDLYLKNKWGM